MLDLHHRGPSAVAWMPPRLHVCTPRLHVSTPAGQILGSVVTRCRLHKLIGGLQHRPLSIALVLLLARWLSSPRTNILAAAMRLLRKRPIQETAVASLHTCDRVTPRSFAGLALE
jgi:hypothetical protein